jgi:exosome complex RNA-binding protein Rrp42 (RNase PH superfamily)
MATATNQNNNGWFIWVMFIVTLVWLICITTSCGVLKNHYLQKYCKEKDSVSYVETTTINFDTIYRTINGEPIYIKSPCDSLGNLKPIAIKRKKNGITASVTSFSNTLVVDCDIDSLLIVNANLTKTIKDYKKITQQVKVNELTKLQGFWIITGQWLLGIFLVYVLFRVFKTYLKGYLPFIK